MAITLVLLIVAQPWLAAMTACAAKCQAEYCNVRRKCYALLCLLMIYVCMYIDGLVYITH